MNEFTHTSYLFSLFMVLGLNSLACVAQTPKKQPEAVCARRDIGSGGRYVTGVYAGRKSGLFYAGHQNASLIMVSNLIDGQWSAPAIALFSGKWSDLEPTMAPDPQHQ